MRNKYGVTIHTLPDPDTFFSDSGSPIYELREQVVDDDGIPQLVVVGKQDIPTMINAYKDLTDMTYIISRLNAGDVSVLNVVPEQYGDVSDMPHDHRAALTAIQNARTYFDQLPEDVRMKFDNDFTNWYSSAGSDKWISNMQRNVETPVASQEVTNES